MKKLTVAAAACVFLATAASAHTPEHCRPLLSIATKVAGDAIPAQEVANATIAGAHNNPSELNYMSATIAAEMALQEFIKLIAANYAFMECVEGDGS